MDVVLNPLKQITNSISLFICDPQPIISNEETFLQHFLLILKHSLQNSKSWKHVSLVLHEQWYHRHVLIVLLHTGVCIKNSFHTDRDIEMMRSILLLAGGVKIGGSVRDALDYTMTPLWCPWIVSSVCGAPSMCHH